MCVLDKPIDFHKISRERIKIKSYSSSFIKNSPEIEDIFDYNSSFTSISSLDNRLRNRSKRKFNKNYNEEHLKSIQLLFS
jgi:hypothetical protein